MGKKQTPKVTVKKERFIYLGPNLSKDGITTGTVFIGKPTNLKELEGKFKGVTRLFIPLKNIVKAKADIKIKGSLLNITFLEVTKEIFRLIKEEGAK